MGVKLTIQKEATRGTKLQSTIVVEYVVKTMKCYDCAAIFHSNTWDTKVQIRQKVDHKRTFFHLEQLILRHNAHNQVINMEGSKDGMNFYFSSKSHAEKFCKFIASHAPQRLKQSSKLVSSDNHNNTANVKKTFILELVPLCKHDLLILPKQTANRCSSINNLVLVSRVTSQVHLVDPLNGKKAELTASNFWRLPFHALQNSGHMTSFVVLDVEMPVGGHEGHGSDHFLADVEIARESDFGTNDKRYRVSSHLGKFLEAGDVVMGYDLTTSNFSDRLIKDLKHELPDVILVQRQMRRDDYSSRKSSKKRSGKSKQSLGITYVTKGKDMDDEEAERDAARYMDECDLELEQEQGDMRGEVGHVTDLAAGISLDDVSIDASQKTGGNAESNP